MKNQERFEKTQSIIQEQPQNIGQEAAPNPKIKVHVEHFPVAKAKFSKEAWDSGEGGGEGGEGEGEG